MRTTGHSAATWNWRLPEVIHELRCRCIYYIYIYIYIYIICLHDIYTPLIWEGTFLGVQQPTANILKWVVTGAGGDTYVEVTVCGRPCEVVGDPGPQGTGRSKFFQAAAGFLQKLKKNRWPSPYILVYKDPLLTYLLLSVPSNLTFR